MAHAPTGAALEIPERSGEVLCHPPFGEFLSVAASNAAQLNEASISLAGVSLREVRARTRRSALREAAAYGRALGLPAGQEDTERPLIGAGHQPFLFHPGIWTKHLLLDRLHPRAAVVNMPVDCDVAEDVGADVPHFEGTLTIARETLVRMDPDVPYEAIAAPNQEHWTAFLKRLDAHLATLPSRGVREVFAEFVSRTAAITASDIGSFLTLARRAHEGQSGYAELPVSHLARTPEFRLFFLHIAQDAGAFAAAYNRRLDEYRAAYNVRTGAQPFPNLDEDGAKVELPFWLIVNGRRRSVFVEPRPREIRVWAAEELVQTISGTDPDEIAGLELRPKALALTAFSRLCLVDLFIHGVGGGRYDRVTDAVIADVFGITPPRYAVVTATLHLPLGEFDPPDERESLQRRLLEVRHNPERLLAEPSPQQRQWIDEKWALIGRLDGPSLTRRERRETTQRIRELNERLAASLDGDRRALERRLAALPEAAAASAAVSHRGYPFCFFPRRAVDALVDRITQR